MVVGYLVVELSIVGKKSYIFYVKLHRIMSIKKLLSYFGFIKKIALSWIEQDLY